jgi:hypothetical protein
MFGVESMHHTPLLRAAGADEWGKLRELFMTTVFTSYATLCKACATAGTRRSLGLMLMRFRFLEEHGIVCLFLRPDEAVSTNSDEFA